MEIWKKINVIFCVILNYSSKWYTRKSSGFPGGFNREHFEGLLDSAMYNGPINGETLP